MKNGIQDSNTRTKKKSSYGICPGCNQEFISLFVDANHTTRNISKMVFDKWTSENNTIDKLIQDTQQNTNIYLNIIRQQDVALKKFDNFACLNEEFLNEVTIHLKPMFMLQSDFMESQHVLEYIDDMEISEISIKTIIQNHHQQIRQLQLQLQLQIEYKTHPKAIYISRLLDYSNLPKPKNDENFEMNLKDLTML
ncbi:hypothetical protein Glove_267g81 [Diversispora epigaea]|uniref:Uncharacterized protein n=1 Tax=Diversispora epigaea TaxID=1348612 RepID=A0A397ID76_9GLOM|nr:hypothetical protein Glove_267g81 [Diversispora epigaea]